MVTIFFEDQNEKKIEENLLFHSAFIKKLNYFSGNSTLTGEETPGKFQLIQREN